MMRLLAAIVSILLTGACGQQDEVEYRDRSGSDDRVYARQYGPQAAPAPRTAYGDGNYGRGFGGLPSLPTRPQSYPVHSFSANGKIYHRGGEDSLSSQSQFDLTADLVNFRSLDFASSRGEVTQGFQPLKGNTEFTRPSVQELFQLRGGSFIDPGVFIYGKSVRKINGEVLHFSSPVPIVVVAARSNRYDAIPSQGLSYTSQVSGSRNFTLTTKITKVVQNMTAVQIKTEYILANQRDYDHWPLPKEVVTIIDPQTKRVTGLNSASLFYESESGQMRSFYLHHKLCRYAFNGVIEDYCP